MSIQSKVIETQKKMPANIEYRNTQIYCTVFCKAYFLEKNQEVPQNSLLKPAMLSICMVQKGEIAPCQSLMMIVSFSSHNFLQRAVDSVHNAEELGNKLVDEIQYNIMKSNSNFI